MKKLNKTTDVKKYLNCGPLTQPFLTNEYIAKRVASDLSSARHINTGLTVLESLCAFVYSRLRMGDKDFCNEFRFGRSAQEIWQSKLSTGCTDYCLVFATFARQLGIPTTILHTGLIDWVREIKQGNEPPRVQNHSFCECYFDGEWILVDPTYRKITKSYDPKLLTLDYKIGAGNVYVPYKRCVDMETRMTTAEHTEEAKALCKKIDLE